MKHLVAVVALAFGVALPVAAEPALTVHVIDATTSAALNGATIAVDGQVVTTDRDGRAALELAAREWVVEVKAAGYAARTVDVTVDAGVPRVLEVALVSNKLFQERVDVQAPLAGPAPADLPVKPAQVMNVAGGGENIFHTLQTLPGVASPQEFSSRISVRGGGPDENLTVLDGVEIYNPYRLFGLVSAFNPETVESFDLAAGAFDARYGDRLSSLLTVDSRAGTDKHKVAGSVALSLTDSNVILEGRNPTGSGSWLVAGRRTYYDLVAERFTDDDLPSFADLQARSVWDLAGGRKLAFFALRSRETSDLSFDNPKEGDKGAFFERVKNDVLSATFTSPLGARALSRTIVSSYTNTDSLDFGGDLRDKSTRSNAPGDEAFGQSDVKFTSEGRVRDYALREELTLHPGANLSVDAGGELHGMQTRVRFVIPGDRNNQAANGSSTQGGAGLPADLDSTRSDTRLGAWLQLRSNPWPGLSLQPGVRLDRNTVNDVASLSPRVLATYTVRPAMRLHAALGVYRQSPGYEKLVQSDYFSDLSGTGPLALDSERAYHALLGVERDLSASTRLKVESYYKRFDRLVVGRLETPEETAARVAEYDFPSAFASSVPAYSAITTHPTNGGRGRAYGLDVYLAKRETSPDTRLSGWTSYTYGVARREAYGRTLPFEYDRRHAASLVGNLRLSRKLVLSATARFATGFPRTPVTGLRVAATPDVTDRDGDGNRTELVPEQDSAGRLVYTTSLGGISNLNTSRLPAYFRLDTRLNYKPRGRDGRVQLYLDIINVLDRKNAGFLQPELEYDPTSDRPRLVENRQGSIPFLPSLGVHVDLSRRH